MPKRSTHSACAIACESRQKSVSDIHIGTKLTIEVKIVSQKASTRRKERERVALTVRFSHIKVRWLAKYSWLIPRCLSGRVPAMNFYGNADKAAPAFPHLGSDRKTPDRKRATGGWAAEKKRKRREKTRRAEDLCRAYPHGRYRPSIFRPRAPIAPLISTCRKNEANRLVFFPFFCEKRAALGCTSLPRCCCTTGWSRGPTRIPGHLISLSSAFLIDERSSSTTLPSRQTKRCTVLLWSSSNENLEICTAVILYYIYFPTRYFCQGCYMSV